jgi:L-threonylcarbamoyladenylate synthase
VTRVLAATSTAVDEAASIVRSGGVIVFPTETVYGIGASINEAAAVRRVFGIKRRPLTEPLMAHCGSAGEAAALVGAFPVPARRLGHAFWPGPLALVLPGRADAGRGEMTGGRSIGIRVVAQSFTADLCLRIGVALAGTSANLHGRPATNDFARLDPELLGQADIVIDAGVSGSGQASTILDLTCEPPRLVREGAVSLSEIESVLGTRLERGPAPKGRSGSSTQS